MRLLQAYWWFTLFHQIISIVLRYFKVPLRLGEKQEIFIMMKGTCTRRVYEDSLPRLISAMTAANLHSYILP